VAPLVARYMMHGYVDAENVWRAFVFQVIPSLATVKSSSIACALSAYF
jgi:hypothetical protein